MSKELYDDELVKAHEGLITRGRTPGDYGIEMEFMEPDPDGGGMFTVQYLVTIVNAKTGKGLRSIGGIGNDWVGHFLAEVDEGYFD
jgi:hypothetical protein